MPIDQITAEVIDVIKFRRPVIDRRTGEETDEWIDCARSYTNQALRTLRVMLGKAKGQVEEVSTLCRHVGADASRVVVLVQGG